MKATSPTGFALTYLGLVALTVATVGLSLLRLGQWHIGVGLGIAAVKVGLVALVFMHLVRSPARTWLAAGVELFWLGILLFLTMTDYLFRQEAAY